MMTPIQEIDVHTSKKVFYQLHIVSPTETAPFFSEINVYDSEFEIPFASTIKFHKQFQTPNDAFEHAMKWIKIHSAKYGYPVNRINNPCNCEFLDDSIQSTIVTSLGITGVKIEVNGV